jgi:hypothetical protein
VPLLPECGFTCLPDFFDVDLDPANGCECEFIDAYDLPFDGIDSDCDGQDGNPSDALYVSALLGSAGAAGTESDPLDTISEALDQIRSGASVAEYVVVGLGTYVEDVELVEGVDVFGGYNLDFQVREPSFNPTVIEGTGNGPAVLAQGISTPTSLDGFRIEGRTNRALGAPAIAVWLEDCTNEMALTNNIIVSDQGEPGSLGLDGTDGDDGIDGDAGEDAEITTCVGMTQGGDGGQLTCGALVVNGGDGGDSRCPSAFVDQPDGQNGLPAASGGVAGLGTCDAELGYNALTGYCHCSIDACWGNATDGTEGGSGNDGTGGIGGDWTDGFFAAGGVWVADGGIDGTDGESGAGAGGGGVGSGAEDVSCGTGDQSGGTGGGGGSGGCGAPNGEGGFGGGASYGVVLYYPTPASTLPVITGNDIVADDGGIGGPGGDGGLGGLGGNGGVRGGQDPNFVAWCAESGGNGGDGGKGGEGGGGGGGAGGSSYAVIAIGTTPAVDYVVLDNTLTFGISGNGGAGGSGGSTLGSDGYDGLGGASGDVNW